MRYLTLQLEDVYVHPLPSQSKQINTNKEGQNEGEGGKDGEEEGKRDMSTCKLWMNSELAKCSRGVVHPGHRLPYPVLRVDDLKPQL